MSRKRMKPKYKQMAFETAVRNPERYIWILKALKELEWKILDDNTLLNAVAHLHLIWEVKSSKLIIDDDTKQNQILEAVKKIHSTRKAERGFPQWYQSRFWTYMRTLSELWFVYAEYWEKFHLSDIAKMLVSWEIDEQEAFSIQAIQYNRKSPHRNVSNDFNFFTFILKVLLIRKRLSYEQFNIAMFSKNGNVEEFLEIIENNKFKDWDDVYNFLETQKVDNPDFHVNAIRTVTREYPDVVRRLFIICGFVSIRFSWKKMIEINENKIEYIKEILKSTISYGDEEKYDAFRYYKNINSNSKDLLEIAYWFRGKDELDWAQYSNKLLDIIKTYNITRTTIISSINMMDDWKSAIPEFNDIPKPLKLEFYISLLIALEYKNELFIKPNYKADHIWKPYSHAPWNKWDIEVFSNTLYWLIEVTLIRNKAQQLNHETTSVIRHLNANEEMNHIDNKYISFIAPYVHEDTFKFFNYCILDSKKEWYTLNIKPYSIEDFITVTWDKANFWDMEKYSNQVMDDFRSSLL